MLQYVPDIGVLVIFLSDVRINFILPMKIKMKPNIFQAKQDVKDLVSKSEDSKLYWISENWEPWINFILPVKIRMK